MKIRGLIKFLAVMLSLSPAVVQAQISALPSFADLAEELMPSVVNISTLHAKEDSFDDSGEIETSVQSIFNAPKTNKVSLGSGFILDEDGYIITNSHVVDKAQSISVVLADGREIEAEIIGTDGKTDIALIKINSTQKLKPVKLGDSDKIRVGDWILSIGNPFGLGGSVTAGIVSAKSRDIESGPYDSFIQTDASINQGNSGGPMFNLNGEVIGINTAIFSTTGGNMGVSFAIPINLAQFVIRQLKENGIVRRGWIGVKMQANSADVATSLGLAQNQGAVISAVSDNSSAYKAGIRPGDIVLKFDNHQIDNTKNLSRIVAETPIGKNVPVEIWRDDKKIALNILIEEMPKEDLPEQKGTQEEISDGAFAQENSVIKDWGFDVVEITPEIRNKHQLSNSVSGVVVSSVSQQSDAFIKGLKNGDVITQIDKKPIVNAEDVLFFLKEAFSENKRPALLQIDNNGDLHFVAVKPNAGGKKL